MADEDEKRLQAPNGLISPVLTPLSEDFPAPGDDTRKINKHGEILPQEPESLDFIKHEDGLLLAESPNSIKYEDDENKGDGEQEMEVQNTRVSHTVDGMLSIRSRAKSLPTSPINLLKLQDAAFDGTSEVKTEVLRISAAQLNDLVASSGSITLRAVSPIPEEELPISSHVKKEPPDEDMILDKKTLEGKTEPDIIIARTVKREDEAQNTSLIQSKDTLPTSTTNDNMVRRPSNLPRSISVPSPSMARSTMPGRVKPTRLNTQVNHIKNEEEKVPAPSAIPQAQLRPRPASRTQTRDHSHSVGHASRAPPAESPNLSIPDHLQRELSSDRTPAFYSARGDSYRAPYESAQVKFERLRDFFLLPPILEQVLLFGACCCLDAWLYEFTILPLRFIGALWLLFQWIVISIFDEIMSLPRFVYRGLGRLWYRRRRGSSNAAEKQKVDLALSNGHVNGQSPYTPDTPTLRKRIRASLRRSQPLLHNKPSLLQAGHKADLLEGLLIIVSCVFLMRFDASRMYHAIRGQSAIKLYVIYNALEVFDRLFSALGQDIMECLFSAENLERKSNGRSRIIRPLWMFFLALAYTVLHSTAFFYQVITLNVAVNSYSNALLTLLMSNQFVEIKGTVFKKIEKENLFQLTCADVVERFQLWLMLLIIALRNIVELGGLSATSSDYSGPTSTNSAGNATTGVPFRTFGILPQAFTMFSNLFPAQVLVPFLLVLGSEMLVDWLKHAYITKFNATSHKIYGRFLDVLAKDYYSSASAEHGLTRRLGLPTIPLTCLFVRASLQTYHMFLATKVSAPVVASTTSLSLETDATASPVIAQIDHILRSALGRSTFGSATAPLTSSAWTIDDAIALSTMLIVFLAIYLLLLVLKLSLGLALLRFAKERYKGMKNRERQSYLKVETKRVGGYGAVEIGDERRKIIYEGDQAGLKAARDREAKLKEHDEKAKMGDKLHEVDRYSMVAKRIW